MCSFFVLSQYDGAPMKLYPISMSDSCYFFALQCPFELIICDGCCYEIIPL
jgi:hypothetical protein